MLVGIVVFREDSYNIFSQRYLNVCLALSEYKYHIARNCFQHVNDTVDTMTLSLDLDSSWKVDVGYIKVEAQLGLDAKACSAVNIMENTHTHTLYKLRSRCLKSFQPFDTRYSITVMISPLVESAPTKQVSKMIL